MDTMLDEIKTYPELKSYILIDNFSQEQRIVSEKQLRDAFGDEKYAQIRSGRNSYWTLLDNN